MPTIEDQNEGKEQQADSKTPSKDCEGKQSSAKEGSSSKKRKAEEAEDIEKSDTTLQKKSPAKNLPDFPVQMSDEPEHKEAENAAEKAAEKEGEKVPEKAEEENKEEPKQDQPKQEEILKEAKAKLAPDQEVDASKQQEVQDNLDDHDAEKKPEQPATEVSGEASPVGQTESKAAEGAEVEKPMEVPSMD